jgi:hypothetical protein
MKRSGTLPLFKTLTFMESTDVTGNDELGRLDRQIAIECDPVTLIALKRIRQRAQLELESQRRNPELSAIMQNSAARATVSIAIPLPDGHGSLDGPLSPAQLTSLQQASDTAPNAIRYERHPVLSTQQHRHQFFGIFLAFFFHPIFFFFFFCGLEAAGAAPQKQRSCLARVAPIEQRKKSIVIDGDTGNGQVRFAKSISENSSTSGAWSRLTL